MGATKRSDSALAIVTAAVAFALFWPLWELLVRHGHARPYPWRDATAQLGPLLLPRPTGRLFESQVKLEEYVDAADPGRNAPRILRKGREALLVATGPRSSTGYGVDIVSVTEERSRILVRAREQTPSLRDSVRPIVTSPFRLITFRATDKPVFLDWEGRP